MELGHLEILSDRTNPTLVWTVRRLTRTVVIQSFKTVAWLPWIVIQMVFAPLSREAERAGLIAIALTILGEGAMWRALQMPLEPGSETTGYIGIAVIYLAMGILVRSSSRERDFHLVE